MTRISLFIVAILFTVNVVVAQNMPFYNPYENTLAKEKIEKSNYPNILKINTGRLILGDFNLSYERILTQHMSLNFRAQYHSFNYFDRWFENWVAADNDFVVGLSETPDFHFLGFEGEYRFYLQKSKQSRGFYLAPYGRWLHAGASCTALYNTTNLGLQQNFDISMNTSLTVLGIGAQAGLHWLIRDRFSIDWSFAGLGYDMYTFSAGVSSDAAEGAYDDFRRELHDLIGGISSRVVLKYLKLNNLDTTPSYTTFFFLPGVKSSLTLGYAF